MVVVVVDAVVAPGAVLADEPSGQSHCKPCELHAGLGAVGGGIGRNHARVETGVGQVAPQRRVHAIEGVFIDAADREDDLAHP